MQNKYKLPPHIKSMTLAVVRGYESSRAEYLAQREKILTFGSQNYDISADGTRVFSPGAQGSVSQTESKAQRLLKLDGSFAAESVNAVDKAREKLTLIIERDTELEESRKIITAIFESCAHGRNFNFDYSGIDSVSRATFYRYRNIFLYFVAKNMNFL